MISCLRKNPKPPKKITGIRKVSRCYCWIYPTPCKKQGLEALFAISANHFTASAKFNYKPPPSEDMFVLSIKRKH